MEEARHDNARQAALDYHRLPQPGKLSIEPTKRMVNQRDLALAYSPGVAAPCEEIAADPAKALDYTARGNLVAVISNGTAVLGLGAIGALAVLIEFEAAHAEGLRDAIETALGAAIEAGARILYHCSFADDASVDLMARHKDSVFYSPGVGVSIAAIEASPPPHVNMTHMKASAHKRMEAEKVLVPKLKQAGVKIVIGGDYGFPFNPHGTNARDLQHYVDHFGFTPTEALRSATMFGGELMGLETGQVKEGYLADLLLVDGDPTQNVAILQNPANLSMIMLDGKLYKAPAELETV